MRLKEARLCLDCEEVHDTGLCPVCGSESYAYLSRWVPVPDTERPPRPATSEQAKVYRELLATDSTAPPRNRRLLKGGLLGLTALGLAGWAWRSSRNDGKSQS